MKTNRLFAILVVAALIALVALTVQQVVATTAVDSDVNSEIRSFSNEEGLTIYHESERMYGQVMSESANEEDLAIYYESERGIGQFAASAAKDEGMAIYHESERGGVAALTQRLFDGKPFDAYQRSEWLSADQ